MELEEVIAGLKQGRTLCVDRCDCPLLPDLLRLVGEGKLTQEFHDNPEEQYSVLKFRWKKD